MSTRDDFEDAFGALHTAAHAMRARLAALEASLKKADAEAERLRMEIDVGAPDGSWQATSEGWRKATVAWQEWAQRLLPPWPDGVRGDSVARDEIEAIVAERDRLRAVLETTRENVRAVQNAGWEIARNEARDILAALRARAELETATPDNAQPCPHCRGKSRQYVGPAEMGHWLACDHCRRAWEGPRP